MGICPYNLNPLKCRFLTDKGICTLSGTYVCYVPRGAGKANKMEQRG